MVRVKHGGAVGVSTAATADTRRHDVFLFTRDVHDHIVKTSLRVVADSSSNQRQMLVPDKKHLLLYS